MRRFVALLVVGAALLASGCMNKPRHLFYPDGVTIVGWRVPNFEYCIWTRAPNAPGPCPLVVHLPTGDLGDKELSDAAALKRAGWEEETNGNLLLRVGTGLVVCGYQGGVLNGVTVSVRVSTFATNRNGPIEFSVGGKRLSLPNTDEGITAALGQPLRRD